MFQQLNDLILIQVAQKHLNLNLTVIPTVIPMESPIKNLTVIPMISLINVQMINLIRMMIHLIKIKEKKIKKMIRKKNQKAYFVIFFQTF
ncbi:Uncharacterised protein [Neisseria meningitidis]|nr:Uncharacterised protein [Neisseria meningitidis]